MKRRLLTSIEKLFKQEVRIIFSLTFAFLLSSNFSTVKAQTFAIDNATKVTTSPQNYNMDGIGAIYKSTGGSSVSTAELTNACDGYANGFVCGSSIFIFRTDVTINNLVIRGTGGTGSARTLSSITTSTALNGTYTNYTTYTSSGTVGGSNKVDCGNMTISTTTNIPAGTYMKFTFNGNPYVSSIVLSLTSATEAPTTQASDITFSDVTTNSMTVNWENGDGANRAVFVKEDGGAITNPVAGTTYTASADWSATGDQLGTSGYYCVYNGTGNSVALTNLDMSKDYTVQVFEYNGDSGEEAYLTAAATDNPKTHAATLPPAPPTSVNDQITITGPNAWASGNKTSYTYESGDVITFPSSTSQSSGHLCDGAPRIVQIDNFTFVNNSTSISNIVINGQSTGSLRTLSSISVGGIPLVLNTSYTTSSTINDDSHCGVLEIGNLSIPVGSTIAITFSGKISISSIVLTPIASTTTAPTTQASNITFADVTTNSMTLNWENGDGANRAVFVKEDGGAIENPVDGTTYTASTDWSAKGTQLATSGYYCVYNGTGNSVALTNLDMSKDYTVQVFEYNGDSGEEAYFIETAADNPKTHAAVLPITLTSFKASAQADGIGLNWATSSENNADKFVVERRTATSVFTDITTITAKGNSGNTYSYKDKNVANGETYYYRLKMVDNDGSFAYSALSPATFTLSAAATVSVYPNPATNSVTISYPETGAVANLSITDTRGAVVLTAVIPAKSTQTTLNVSTLKTGIYIININTKEGRKTLKLVKD